MYSKIENKEMIKLSANPRLYNDAELTDELVMLDSDYELQLGPDTGVDGDIGETITKQLWLLNDGDEIHQDVTLEEVITDNRVEYSLDGTSYSQTLSFGDVAVGEDIGFYVRLNVEEGAPAGRYNLTFRLRGKSI